MGTSEIEDGSITHADVAAGFVVQAVNSQTGALATGTTTVPSDDTIPQNTEGDQYLSLAITPKSATNKLKIDVVLNLANSAAGNTLAAALFQDATAGALAAVWHTANGANPLQLNFTHWMTAGTTSETAG